MTFPRKILVAIDFDDVSDGAFHAALDLARTTHARVCVMTAPGESVTERAASQHVASVVQRAGATDLQIETQVETGVPHEAIVKAAKHVGADMVVVGTHARSSMSAAGSVANAVTRASTVPVLVVPGALPRS